MPHHPPFGLPLRAICTGFLLVGAALDGVSAPPQPVDAPMADERVTPKSPTVLKLWPEGVPNQLSPLADLHLYNEGEHGFGVQQSDLPVSGWRNLAIQWMRHHKFLPSPAPTPR